jgi:beta-galactosidase
MPFLFLVLVSLLVSPLFGQVSFGNATSFNAEWKFQKGDSPEWSRPDLDDSAWRELELPHDWSVEGPHDRSLASATGYLPGGIAWYRKSFEAPDLNKGKRFHIHFEGIYRNGEIFLNGVSLGMRPNGYLPVTHDLSARLKPGKNIIAVRVDHGESADSRWYTGSGIYRDVQWIESGPIHLAERGVFFRASSVTSESASAKADTMVVNTTGHETKVKVIHELIDPQGKVTAHATADLTVPAGSSSTVGQDMLIPRPHRWSPDTPTLYILRTVVSRDGEILDRSEFQTGFRSLEFLPDRGFLLNGSPLKVKGVCVHHDAGSLGAAVPKEIWKRRLVTLKSLGCNAIRTSHNPQASDLLDLCDELGLLVLNEAFDEWEYPKKKWLEGWNVGKPGFQGHASFFKEWSDRDLRDFVLRDRNHPSVFMWSIGNEIDYPNDPYSHPILDKESIGQPHIRGYQKNQPHADRLGEIARRLAGFVRGIDPTRPVTAGLAGPVMSNETTYPDALDVVGYNYSESRYTADRMRFPKRVFYGSENGHSLDAWKAVRDNEAIFGQFLWTGVDYLGEAGPWPSRGSNAGLLDLAGFVKSRGWFRQSLWSDTPMAKLATQPTERARGFRGGEPQRSWKYEIGNGIRVLCYTNLPKVSLKLNGRIIGEPRVRDDSTGIIEWELPFEAGKLEVVGRIKDRDEVMDVLETSGSAQAIQAKVWEPGTLTKNGVAQVEIRIVDAQGRPLPGVDEEVTCTVNGPLILLGMESGNSRDVGDLRGNRLRTHRGALIAYLRAKGSPGKAAVTFSAPSLKESVVEIEVGDAN